MIEIKSWLNENVLYSGEYDSLKACVSSAIKEGADLSGADLSGANLSGANLSRANLSGANLSRANLFRANLSGADLFRANLFRADLFRANLSRANLSGANLSGADLFRANLSGANLSGANLSGADLFRANLSGANIDPKYSYISISPIGSEDGCLWTMKNEQGVLIYNRGCFSGTREEFLSAVKKKHGGTIQEDIYMSAVQLIDIKFSEKKAGL